jgi:Tfp pilus assembly protein PilN
MRELEFLPTWYPQLQKRKRRVITQVWMLLILVAGLSMWTGVVRKNVFAKQTAKDNLAGELTQIYADQKLLAAQKDLRKQLQEKREVLNSLGFPVQITRLLHTIDNAMPKPISLVSIDCDTDETVRPITSIAGVGAATPGVEKKSEVDRRMKVKIIGLAPNDAELANFLAGLTAIPFFDQVTVSYLREKVDSGHVMREFEITFSLNLNQAT